MTCQAAFGNGAKTGIVRHQPVSLPVISTSSVEEAMIVVRAIAVPQIASCMTNAVVVTLSDSGSPYSKALTIVSLKISISFLRVLK